MISPRSTADSARASGARDTGSSPVEGRFVRSSDRTTSRMTGRFLMGAPKGIHS